jgi:hypothetical protein
MMKAAPRRKVQTGSFFAPKLPHDPIPRVRQIPWEPIQFWEHRVGCVDTRVRGRAPLTVGVA